MQKLKDKYHDDDPSFHSVVVLTTNAINGKQKSPTLTSKPVYCCLKRNLSLIKKALKSFQREPMTCNFVNLALYRIHYNVGRNWNENLIDRRKYKWMMHKFFESLLSSNILVDY